VNAVNIGTWDMLVQAWIDKAASVVVIMLGSQFGIGLALDKKYLYTYLMLYLYKYDSS
jgi:hypothetical protein